MARIGRVLGGVAVVVGLGAGLVLPATGAGATTVKQAKKYLLTKADMPKGWTSSSSGSGSNTNFPGGPALASCIGVPASVINANPPTANSPDFSSKDSTELVGDSVQIYKSTSAAKADFAALTNAKTTGCLQTTLNGVAKSEFAAGFGSGTTVGNIVVSRLPASDLPKHTSDFVLTFKLTSQGSTLNIEIIATAFLKGNLEQSVAFSGIQKTFPVSLARQLTTVANNRL